MYLSSCDKPVFFRLEGFAQLSSFVQANSIKTGIPQGNCLLRRCLLCFTDWIRHTIGKQNRNSGFILKFLACMFCWPKRCWIFIKFQMRDFLCPYLFWSIVWNAFCAFGGKALQQDESGCGLFLCSTHVATLHKVQPNTKVKLSFNRHAKCNHTRDYPKCHIDSDFSPLLRQSYCIPDHALELSISVADDLGESASVMFQLATVNLSCRLWRGYISK